MYIMLIIQNCSLNLSIVWLHALFSVFKVHLVTMDYNNQMKTLVQVYISG